MNIITGICGLGAVALIIAAVIGWIMNLVSVVKLGIAGSAITTYFVAKVVGIFAFPLGAVLGYF